MIGKPFALAVLTYGIFFTPAIAQNVSVGGTLNGVSAGISVGTSGISGGIAAGGSSIAVGANIPTNMSALLGTSATAGISATATPGSAQYDPASYIPFQTAEQAGTINTQLGPMAIDTTVITAIYANPNAPPATSVVNGLPQTNLDSFVYEAAGQAELIYGDEGATTIPPYFEFDQTHRINEGITGVRNQGITTGHGSMLPNAWGGDEFVKTEPFTMSGNNGGNLEGAGIAPGTDDNTALTITGVATGDLNPADSKF